MGARVRITLTAEGRRFERMLRELADKEVGSVSSTGKRRKKTERISVILPHGTNWGRSISLPVLFFEKAWMKIPQRSMPFCRHRKKACFRACLRNRS